MHLLPRLNPMNSFIVCLKWAIWIILAAFPLSTCGAEPLTVVNPYVSADVLRKVCKIEMMGQPVIVLNPHVEPFDLCEIGPYRCILPSPQIVFPGERK